MSWLSAALLGLIGGATTIAFGHAVTMAANKKWPWNSRRQIGPIVSAGLLQLFGSAAVPAVVALDGRTSSPLALFLLGIAAPAVVARASQTALALAQIEQETQKAAQPESGGSPQ